MRIAVNVEWCKGCGICVEFCPASALVMADGRKAAEVEGRCTGCGLCARLCPDLALEIIPA